MLRKLLAPMEENDGSCVLSCLGESTVEIATAAAQYAQWSKMASSGAAESKTQTQRHFAVAF